YVDGSFENSHKYSPPVWFPSGSHGSLWPSGSERGGGESRPPGILGVAMVGPCILGVAMVGNHVGGYTRRLVLAVQPVATTAATAFLPPNPHTHPSCSSSLPQAPVSSALRWLVTASAVTTNPCTAGACLFGLHWRAAEERRLRLAGSASVQLGALLAWTLLLKPSSPCCHPMHSSHTPLLSLHACAHRLVGFASVQLAALLAWTLLQDPSSPCCRRCSS
ncbi:unnamed protein product, partial [Closterium sp. Naga37s-1]